MDGVVFVAPYPGRVVVALLNPRPVEGGDDHRAEVRPYRQRKIVVQTASTGDAAPEGIDHFVEQHLSGIVKDLAMRIRLKPEIFGQRMTHHQRRTPDRLVRE